MQGGAAWHGDDEGAVEGRGVAEAWCVAQACVCGRVAAGRRTIGVGGQGEGGWSQVGSRGGT